MRDARAKPFVKYSLRVVIQLYLVDVSELTDALPTPNSTKMIHTITKTQFFIIINISQLFRDKYFNEGISDAETC